MQYRLAIAECERQLRDRICNNVCGIFAYYILGLLSLSLHFVNFKQTNNYSCNRNRKEYA